MDLCVRKTRLWNEKIVNLKWTEDIVDFLLDKVVVVLNTLLCLHLTVLMLYLLFLFLLCLLSCMKSLHLKYKSYSLLHKKCKEIWWLVIESKHKFALQAWV